MVMFDTKTSSNAAADTADIHRNAYNAAFYELGLKWYWDGRIYPSVLGRDDERDCLRTYLQTHQSHLLKAYDAEFLIDAIQTTKARCYETMTAEGCGAGAHVNWAEMQQGEVGV
jgi:hypothetical protein